MCPRGIERGRLHLGVIDDPEQQHQRNLDGCRCARAATDASASSTTKTSCRLMPSALSPPSVWSQLLVNIANRPWLSTFGRGVVQNSSGPTPTSGQTSDR